MKKIIFSIMAVAALAACTKSEVQYEPSGEISFAPVAKTLTKSVAGYNGDTFDGVFPTNVNLYVFANASNDAGTAWDAPQQGRILCPSASVHAKGQAASCPWRYAAERSAFPYHGRQQDQDR